MTFYRLNDNDLTQFAQKMRDCCDICARSRAHRLRRQKQGGGTFRRRRPAPLTKEVLAEVVRNVVERVVQRVADRGHRTDGSDGNKSSDQAILDGGRTLLILKKLQKLRHFRSPTGAIQRNFSPTLRARLDAICS